MCWPHIFIYHLYVQINIIILSVSGIRYINFRSYLTPSENDWTIKINAKYYTIYKFTNHAKQTNKNHKITIYMYIWVYHSFPPDNLPLDILRMNTERENLVISMYFMAGKMSNVKVVWRYVKAGNCPAAKSMTLIHPPLNDNNRAIH